VSIHTGKKELLQRCGVEPQSAHKIASPADIASSNVHQQLEDGKGSVVETHKSTKYNSSGLAVPNECKDKVQRDLAFKAEEQPSSRTMAHLWTASVPTACRNSYSEATESQLPRMKSFTDFQPAKGSSSMYSNKSTTMADLRRADESWRPLTASEKMKYYETAVSQSLFRSDMLYFDHKRDDVIAFKDRFLKQSNQQGWSLDCSCESLCELSYEGFFPGIREVACEDGTLLQVLLPWWGSRRSMLEISSVHISRRVRKHSHLFTMTVDHAFDDVLLGCKTAW